MKTALHASIVYARILGAGFKPMAYNRAVARGDEDAFSILHPVNFMTEDEAETPGLLDEVLVMVEASTGIAT